ncbi:protein FAR1-RELATED SEQUENCE 6-like [Durio zibethinus]|uniref:Protein FAR1-RELATED SEQUENCE n=1 Tax=Durio zibethinus TaxID=66656 RepID=A0A6P5ZNK3_DURZI|nr:protein FAR1-RELATED SEQUENCE 6-like [Durio zibethinus]
MEEVCLNSEPVFDEIDEYEGEGEGDCSAVEHDDDDESGAKHSEKEPSQPTVGLEFDSFDEAYDFDNIYAKEQGFGIRVSNSWFRSKKKKRYRAKLSCTSAGFKKKSDANNPRPETRTGCPATVVIRLVDSKRWRIVEVELEHNHQVSPQIKSFYESYKKMILAARMAQPPAEPITEIHTIKLYRTAAMDAGFNGYSNVSEREGIHLAAHPKHLELKEGDAYAVYNCFCCMKLTKPNFFYSMDLDVNGHLKNVFWADARSRAAYRVPEKLGGLKGFEETKRQLNKAVYNSLKIVKFETSWAEIIKQHGLGDNKWLQTLYEARKLWVPEFVDKYDLALHRNHLKEATANMQSRNSCFELKTRCDFEVQLSKVYTKEIFNKFQSEVKGMYSCFNTRQVSVNGPIITYIVKETVEIEGNENDVRGYEVLFETSQMDIRCICNFKCRHADQGSNDTDVYSPVHWPNHLHECAVPVVEGAQSQEHYKIALHELQELLNRFNLLEDSFL